MYGILQKYLFSATLLLFLAACGGSDDGGTTPPQKPNLTGTYFGTIHDASDNQTAIDPMTVEVVIDGDQLQSVSFDGIDQNINGSITFGSVANTYFVSGANIETGFTVSPDGNYVGFLSDIFMFGILQKGASTLTTYAQEDLLGGWSGIEVILNNEFDIMRNGTSYINVASNGSFTGTGVNGVINSSSNVTLSNATFGIATSEANSPLGTSVITTMLSPDARAAASYACLDNIRIFDYCAFYLITKPPAIPANPTTSEVGLINIELMGTTNPTDRIFQLWLGELSGTALVPCMVTKPYNPIPVVSCSDGSFDATTNVLSVPMSGIAGNPTLALDFTDMANITVTTNNAMQGSAVKVSTALRARTQRQQDNSEFSVFAITNPNPKFGTAVLTGATANPITLWDNNNNYVNAYNSYLLDDITDGSPQGTGAYVSRNTQNNGFYNSGTWTVTLSNHVDDSNRVERYQVFYNRNIPVTLFSSNPPRRTDIRIGGLSMASANFSNPITLNNGQNGYTLTWNNTTVDPNNTRWSVRFRVVSGSSSNHLRHRELRTPRMLPGSNGLTYANNEFSWTTPPEFALQLAAGEIAKINLRASNSDNTLNGQSQGVFVYTQ